MTVTVADWIMFVDALIPGDGEFPAASAVGTHEVAARRWHAWHHTEPALVGLAQNDATMAISRIEVCDPTQFTALRVVVYLAYYEQPSVVEIIRGLGFRYNATPLPDGYDLPPFNPAMDAPHHHRGYFVATSKVGARGTLG